MLHMSLMWRRFCEIGCLCDDKECRPAAIPCIDAARRRLSHRDTNRPRVKESYQNSLTATSEIMRTFSAIGIEGLNVRGMIINRTMFRAITDIGDQVQAPT
jgi:hypothetical protein